MTPEGLIELDETPKVGAQRFARVALLLVTGLLVLGTTFVDLVFPLESPKLQGAEAREYAQLRKDAHWSDGSLARFVELDYRVTSRVRSAVAKPYSNFLLRFLNEVGGGCVAGPDGWIFMEDRLLMAAGPIELSAGRTAAENAFLARRLMSMGMRHTMVLIPRKGAMAGESLPISYEPHREFEEAVLDQFRRQGVETVDLLGPWDANPEEEHVYRRRDTHWSTVGIRIAAEEVARFCGQLAGEGERLGLIQQLGGPPHEGGLYGVIGCSRGPGDLRYAEQKPYFVRLGNAPLRGGDPQSSIVVCGTSFCSNDTFATFLSHYFGTPVQNFASPGDVSEVSLERMLTGRVNKVLPELVIQEVPGHFHLAFAANPTGWSAQSATERISQANPPTLVLPLPIDVGIQGLKAGQERKMAGGAKLLELPEGLIAHSGGGVVQMGVDLVYPDDDAKMLLICGPFKWTQKVKQGWGRYTFPVLMQRPGSDLARVYIQLPSKEKTANYTVAGWSLYTDVNPTTAQPGTVGDLVLEGQGGSQTLTFPSGTKVRPQSTLVIQTSQNTGTWKPLRVTVQDKTGQIEQTFDFPELAEGGVIVLVPGLLSGHELGQVQLQGTHQGDTAPQEWATTINLYDVNP